MREQLKQTILELVERGVYTPTDAPSAVYDGELVRVTGYAARVVQGVVARASEWVLSDAGGDMDEMEAEAELRAICRAFPEFADRFNALQTVGKSEEMPTVRDTPKLELVVEPDPVPAPALPIPPQPTPNLGVEAPATDLRPTLLQAWRTLTERCGKDQEIAKAAYAAWMQANGVANKSAFTLAQANALLLWANKYVPVIADEFATAQETSVVAPPTVVKTVVKAATATAAPSPFDQANAVFLSFQNDRSLEQQGEEIFVRFGLAKRDENGALDNADSEPSPEACVEALRLLTAIKQSSLGLN